MKIVRCLSFIVAILPVAVGINGCSPVVALNAVTPTDTYRTLKNIAYGSGARQRLDVYQPLPTANQPPPAGYPVVVFFYGGSWNWGNRADYTFVGEALASRGIIAVLADYRLYPQVRYPDFLNDCAAAVAWALKAAPRYGGDPKRLFVMGHSAGAYNAAMLALDPRWLKTQNLTPAVLAGWIGLAGPYDFLPIENRDVQPVFNHPDYPPGSQPIVYASKNSPRAFLGAATSDALVDPIRNTQQMADKLRAAGVVVELKMYPRVNHISLVGAFAYPLRWLAPVRADVATFILKPT